MGGIGSIDGSLGSMGGSTIGGTGDIGSTGGNTGDDIVGSMDDIIEGMGGGTVDSIVAGVFRYNVCANIEVFFNLRPFNIGQVIEIINRFKKIDAISNALVIRVFLLKNRYYALSTENCPANGLILV